MMKPDKGITLIELLIAGAIITIVFNISIYIFTSNLFTGKKEMKRLELIKDIKMLSMLFKKDIESLVAFKAPTGFLILKRKELNIKGEKVILTFEKLLDFSKALAFSLQTSKQTVSYLYDPLKQTLTRLAPKSSISFGHGKIEKLEFYRITFRIKKLHEVRKAFLLKCIIKDQPKKFYFSLLICQFGRKYLNI